MSESLLNLCLSQVPGHPHRAARERPTRWTIIRDGRVLASATSTNLEPATATASKPSCFESGSSTVTIQVSTVSGQSAEDFRLVTSGSW